MQTETTAGSVKQAGKPYVASLSPEAAGHNEALKAQLLRMLARAGVLGLAGGAGVGLLTHYLGQHKVKTPESDDLDLELPYPQFDKKGVDAGALLRMGIVPATWTGINAAAGGVSSPDAPMAGASYGAARGLLQGLGMTGGALLGRRYLAPQYGTLLEQLAGALAGGTVGWGAGRLAAGPGLKLLAGEPPWKKHKKQADWADTAVKTFIPTPTDQPSPTVGSPRWVRGDSMTSLTAIPWAIPAGVTAGLGGLIGGRQLVRWLLRKKRKSDLERELNETQQAYEAAMQEQFDPARTQDLGKMASANPDRLDQLYDAWSEKAGLSLNNLLGHGAGVYGTLAGILAGGSGVATYKYLQGRSPTKILERALKHRAMLRSSESPPDVHLQPFKVHEHKHKDKDKSEGEHKHKDHADALPEPSAP